LLRRRVLELVRHLSFYIICFTSSQLDAATATFLFLLSSRFILVNILPCRIFFSSFSRRDSEWSAPILAEGKHTGNGDLIYRMRWFKMIKGVPLQQLIEIGPFEINEHYQLRLF
jgi:hypothetical protein